MFTSARALTILFVGLGFSVTALGATYVYRLTEIPLNQVPGAGLEAYGRAISNAGHVTGITNLPNPPCCTEAFLWAGTTSLLSFFSPPPDEAQFNEGTDVNHLGQVTGYFNNGDFQSAFFWDGATKTLLENTLGGHGSYGAAINSRGHITGHAFLANGSPHAFLWDGITMRDLGTLGGSNSVGTGINAAEHVTGYSVRPDGLTRAFLWDGTSMRSLGTLGGSGADADSGFNERSSSRATAINSKGQVVGDSFPKSGPIHAFLWQNGSMEDIGALHFGWSRAFAINNSGQVVGQFQSTPSPGHSGAPFLYENGTIRDVNSLIAATDPLKSLFTLTGVFDINNVGQMTGHARHNSDEDISRAYLISPAYKLSAFLKPNLDNWRRGSTVRIVIAVLDDNRVHIPDQRAQALQAVSCRVKVSATGAQSLNATCMKYDPTTNEFWLDWNLAGTGTGPATITAQVNYGAPGPLKVQKTKNITVTA